jgi:hypothetical protein
MPRRRQLGSALQNIGAMVGQWGSQRAGQQHQQALYDQRAQQQMAMAAAQQHAQAAAQRPGQLAQLAELSRAGVDPAALESLAGASDIDLGGLDLAGFQPSTRERLAPLQQLMLQNPAMATPDVIELLAGQMGVEPGMSTGMPAQSPALPGAPDIVRTQQLAPEVQQLQQLGTALQAATPNKPPIPVNVNQRLFDPATQRVLLEAQQDPVKPTQVTPGGVLVGENQEVLFRNPPTPQAAPRPEKLRTKVKDPQSGTGWSEVLKDESGREILRVPDVAPPSGDQFDPMTMMMLMGMDPVERDQFLQQLGRGGAAGGTAPPAMGMPGVPMPGRTGNPFRK